MAAPSLHLKIPKERVGVLVGTHGQVKRAIERQLRVKLNIDSESGDVEIILRDMKDPSLIFRAQDVVLAIGRGFSPQRAFKLMEDEDTMLRIIDLREIFGRSQSNIVRVKGRIIGRQGKTRRLIEEVTGAYLSVYGHTIAIIGRPEQAQLAEEAVRMLIKGAMHSTVYRYLFRRRRQLKREEQFKLWEPL